MRLLPKGVTKGLGDFTSNFLKGVWYGMGPDVTKRTIKTPSKPRPKSMRR